MRELACAVCGRQSGTARSVRRSARRTVAGDAATTTACRVVDTGTVDCASPRVNSRPACTRSTGPSSAPSATNSATTSTTPAPDRSVLPNTSSHGRTQMGWLVGWSLASLFSTNTAISETNSNGYKGIYIPQNCHTWTSQLMQIPFFFGLD